MCCRGDVVDQLLNQNGLADAGAAEQTDLAALGVGADQVNDLDAGLENFRGGLPARQRQGAARWMGQRSTFSGAGCSSTGSPSRSNTRPRQASPTGTLMGPPVSTAFDTADKAVGGGHGNAADDAIADMLGNLDDQLFAVFSSSTRVQQGGQLDRPWKRMSRTGPMTCTTFPMCFSGIAHTPLWAS